MRERKLLRVKSYNKFDINLWPYLELAALLRDKKRKGVGTMFRHQVETFTILIEYGYTNPVLLKAACIHDILEDGPGTIDALSEKIQNLDEDGNDVLELVREMTIRQINGANEPKGEYLTRIMNSGSNKARLLKLADRISNVASLAVINNLEFIKRYLEETIVYILPHARSIDAEMAEELEMLIELKTRLL